VTGRRVILALGCALVATACADPSGPTAGPTADPTGIPWELQAGTIDGAAVTLVSGHPITLTMTGGEASGTAACNGYGAGVTLSGSGIEFSGLGATEMACAPAEVMESESQYLEALPRVTTYASTAESLTLTGDGVELDFIALPPVPIADLTGTVWVLESLIQGEIVSSVDGDRATLELFTDGSMLGSTGCRNLHGRHMVSGAEVVMTEMAAEGECPADLQDQDSHVVNVLGDGFRASVDGQTLTLTSMGDLGLAYRAEG
jgi:heat shock protein HslJ